MKFTLVWMRGAETVGAKSFERLNDATLHAEENIGAAHARFGATAVKVVGVDGTPHYLRALSR